MDMVKTIIGKICTYKESSKAKPKERLQKKKGK